MATQRVAPLGADPDIPSASAAPPVINPGDSHLTVYVSPEDRALLASSLLFRSKRMGRFSLEDVDEEAAVFWKTVGYLNVIKVPATRTDPFGHSYFTSHPDVSSDLVSLLRFNREPGDPLRPLEPLVVPILWELRQSTERQ